MEPGYFIIAILGCADGSVACTPVMTVPARYESKAACAAAAPAALLANANFDFPSLFAECRPGTGPASAEREPKAPPANDMRRG
jgi:hypothetical protein